MKKGIEKTFVITNLILLFLLCTYTAGYASPDPIEVEKRKSEAPWHVIGTVVNDEFYKDMASKNNDSVQLRKMNLKVKETIMFPPEVSNADYLTVFYTYTPAWQVKDKGGRMDIAITDEIEIWLEEGEYGLEPILSGNSVEHISFAPLRPEHIEEPFFHFIQRQADYYWATYTGYLVLAGILLFTAVVMIVSMQRKV